MKKIFELLSGDRKYFEQAYLRLYGKQDSTEEIESIKRDNLKKYIFLTVIAVVILILSVFFSSSGSNPGISVKNGNEISISRPSQEEGILKIPMKLDVSPETEEGFTRNVVITVRPEVSETTSELEETGEEAGTIAIESEIKKIVRLINNSNMGSELILPVELPGGVKLSWEESGDSRLPLIIPLFLVLVFILYQNRYSRVKKIEKEAKESIMKELPEFINKLVLLLNAGLVLTSAFDRILESYEEGRKEVKSYFYSQLLKVHRSVRETNNSFIGGVKEFAERSGVREFTRIANIISDSMDKGAELVEKLQGESELLWLTKKKLAEEKGRLAETKLTFPLVLLLLALITVTTAPALMEM
jgi:hypothetical protein